MFSIIIPTFNNLKYLKLCLKSIRKNSKFDHEIIIHVNEGLDGTLKFLKNNNYKFSYSKSPPNGDIAIYSFLLQLCT